MSPKNCALILPFLSCSILPSFCQQVTFNAEESYAIHDSITKSRWDWGGRISDYSFRHMSEFFPVAIIEKPTETFPFNSSINNSIGEIVVKQDDASTTFEKYLLSKHVSSIIILHKDTILFEKYYGMLPDELHTLQSVTKVITSTLIAQLENEKKIVLTNPVETYLPELKSTAWQGISVKDILYMRSGIEGAESAPGVHAFTDPKYPYYNFEAALGLLPKTDSTPASVFKYIATLNRKWKPAEKIEYHSVNTFVLGWIAEKITGKKYADLVSEKIWKPMGASSDAYVCLSGSGVPWTHGGMSTTLRDLARFGVLFTKNDIEQRKKKIISLGLVDKILKEGKLAYQWSWVDGESMFKGGFGGQGLYINPEKNIVIVYFNFIDSSWKDTDLLPIVKQVVNVISLNKKTNAK